MAKELEDLLELKAIKEANPSEAMECLKILYSSAKLNVDRIERGGIVTYAEEMEYNESITPYYNTIKQALLNAQESEKVLEVLKPLCEVVETPVKKLRYLKMNGVVVYTFKNKEEFDLLKRYLNENNK